MEATMRRVVIAFTASSSLLLAGAFLLLQSVSAQAADFYVVAQDLSSDDPRVEIIDPATIAPGDGGHKIVHVDDIQPNNSWYDDTWELDCSKATVRSLARSAHGLTDNNTTDWTLSSDSDPGDWQGFTEGTNVAFIYETVCQWPDKKPSDERLISASDFIAAVQLISAKYF
jgi:hypothetical protein